MSDQQIATAYVQGLNKNYSMIKEKFRNLKEYTFLEAVEDATNYAIENKLLNNVKPDRDRDKATVLNGSVLAMCKYWRTKKGCYKKDKCPLKAYHTPDTKGKGWTEEAGAACPVLPDKKGRDRRCFSCNKTGHLQRDCPDKLLKSKNKAKENERKNAAEVANLNLNFMMMTPLTSNLFASFDFKSHWILDSGATEHVCSSSSLMSLGTLSTLTTPAKLTVGNGQVLQAMQMGTVYFNDVSLSGVLVCEQCPVNIISEGKLLEKGLSISKNAQTGCVIKKGKKIIMTAKLQNKLLFVDKALLSSELAEIRRCR